MGDCPTPAGVALGCPGMKQIIENGGWTFIHLFLKNKLFSRRSLHHWEAQKGRTVYQASRRRRWRRRRTRAVRRLGCPNDGANDLCGEAKFKRNVQRRLESPGSNSSAPQNGGSIEKGVEMVSL